MNTARSSVTFGGALGPVAKQPPGASKLHPLMRYRGLDRLTYRALIRQQNRRAAERWAP